VPEPRLHPDPSGEISVRVADGAVLNGSPLAVECVCDTAGTLAGSAIDLPRGEDPLSTPWVDVIGWALGSGEQSVEAVELANRGVPFRIAALDVHRPDLASAFPDVPRAAESGFAERVSVLGVGGRLELEAHAVLATGERVPIGAVDVRVDLPRLDQVIVAVDGGPDGGVPASLLRQASDVGQMFVLNGSGLSGHPGFVGVDQGWETALEEAGAVVWFCDGGESVTAGFLAAATSALANHPDASFAAAVDAQHARRDLIGVMSGTALGCAMLFRASAAREAGGINDQAPNLLAAQWDLAIRLAEAGHEWSEVEEVAPEPLYSLAERAGEDGARWLYERHSALFARRLREVCLDREAAIGRVLRRNHLVERALESEQRPRLRARRGERDRLAAKLRRGNEGSTWGDFRRLEPLSPLWGSERGLCLDRFYIERFLQSHASDLHGTVLECEDATYTIRFGGERVDRVDVIDIDATNPEATVVADLCEPTPLEAGAYDCVLLTQVLQYMRDPSAALAECRRILAPGGVLLATVPCASRVNGLPGPIVEHWRWSAEGFRTLLLDAFRDETAEVSAHGSRNTVVASLTGLATEEVSEELLGRSDPDAPLVLAARVGPPAPEASS
jgi:hypothetical protein